MAKYEMHETQSGEWCVLERKTLKVLFETDDHQECLNYLVELENTDYEMEQPEDL
jgi:hypothetical protein